MFLEFRGVSTTMGDNGETTAFDAATPLLAGPRILTYGPDSCCGIGTAYAGLTTLTLQPLR